MMSREGRNDGHEVRGEGPELPRRAHCEIWVTSCWALSRGRSGLAGEQAEIRREGRQEICSETGAQASI